MKIVLQTESQDAHSTESHSGGFKMALKYTTITLNVNGKMISVDAIIALNSNRLVIEVPFLFKTKAEEVFKNIQAKSGCLLN